METATQILHRLTSYGPGRAWDAPADDPRVVQDLQANDPARRPWFFKRYAQPLPRLPLPRDLPATTAPAIAVLAGAADLPRTELDLAQLSRLLHLSAGAAASPRRPASSPTSGPAGTASRSPASSSSWLTGCRPGPCRSRGRRHRGRPDQVCPEPGSGGTVPHQPDRRRAEEDREQQAGGTLGGLQQPEPAGWLVRRPDAEVLAGQPAVFRLRAEG